MTAERLSATVQCPNCDWVFPLEDDFIRRLATPWVRRAVGDAEQRVREEVGRTVARETAHLRAQLDEARAKNQRQKAEAKVAADKQRRQHRLAIENAVARVRSEDARVHERETAQMQRTFQAQISDLKKTIATMREHGEAVERRGRPGSLQHQGVERARQFGAEVSDRFGGDAVEVVQHGVRGTDLIEEIFSDGRPCGVIVTECKATGKWGGQRWIAKVARDQQGRKASDAILVSDKLPRDVDGIARIGNVWVCDYDHALPLITVIRDFRIADGYREAAAQRKNARAVTGYLASDQFNARVVVYVRTRAQMRKRLRQMLTTLSNHIDRGLADLDTLDGAFQGIVADLGEQGAEMRLPHDLDG
ncbi:DUF2130 domain-containing protein [Nocardia nova]|uniref:DUF2130 domain-containing protein n=1 Tax=Nocardia nova TaxID=37330 RepID=UPI001C47F070|nr:DUF2130 domain-containing protein [Nocardia nova]MBV7706801.1 DUF2130 domain-containing protein [Nocardia nova]